jgi:hypothetical protein
VGGTVFSAELTRRVVATGSQLMYTTCNKKWRNLASKLLTKSLGRQVTAVQTIAIASNARTNWMRPCHFLGVSQAGVCV